MTGCQCVLLSPDSAQIRSLRPGIQLFCVDMRRIDVVDVPLRKAPRSTVLRWLTTHEPGHEWKIQSPGMLADGLYRLI